MHYLKTNQINDLMSRIRVFLFGWNVFYEPNEEAKLTDLYKVLVSVNILLIISFVDMYIHVVNEHFSGNKNI